MKIFDNITNILRDDLSESIQENSKVSIAASYFSIYAFQELKEKLTKIDELKFIFTPVGKYNPDWAITFYEGMVKHIYFVAETKGELSSMQLRNIEGLKVHCAREHFKKISNNEVRYEVVDTYNSLLDEVLK